MPNRSINVPLVAEPATLPLRAEASPREETADFIDGPGPGWLAAGFVLAGIGTVLLGPLLPWLSKAWGLSDAQGGLLLAVKFIGSFLGGFSVPRQLRRGISLGSLLCCVGFGLFGLSAGLPMGCVSLFIAGFGLGQVIASTNILVSRRFTQKTGAALALLNFFWSLGAVITGLLVAMLLPRFGMRDPLLAYGALFLVSGLGGLLATQRARPNAGGDRRQGVSGPLSSPEFFYFAAMLFLYGGLETALSGWLTTYSLRFSDTQWLGGQASIISMWTAITAGRAITSLLMRRWSETLVRNVALFCTLLSIVGLVSSSHAGTQLASCIALGLSLAPFFPATFARLMRHTPKARIAGLILAVSGLGAALFPWLVGVLSVRSGSLRIALSIPFLLTGVLLVLGMMEPRESRPEADPEMAH